MPATPRKTYRLKPQTLATIKAIGEARGGLSDTRVIENAVASYGRKVLGRRLADLVPPRVRDEGRE